MDSHRPDWIREIQSPDLRLIVACDYAQLFGQTLSINDAALTAGAVRRFMAGSGPKRRGRSADGYARLVQSQIDAARYDLIEEIRDKQAEFGREHAALLALEKPPSDRILWLDKVRAKIGTSLEDACAFACEVLDGCRAGNIEAEAMKISYYRVKNGKYSGYPPLFSFSQSMREALDLDVTKGSKKIIDILLA